MSKIDKIDKVIALLNICPECISGYMRSQFYHDSPEIINFVEQHKFIKWTCNKCNYIKHVPNDKYDPDYVPYYMHEKREKCEKTKDAEKLKDIKLQELLDDADLFG
jgi:ribosomal protein S27AE